MVWVQDLVLRCMSFFWRSDPFCSQQMLPLADCRAQDRIGARCFPTYSTFSLYVHSQWSTLKVVSLAKAMQYRPFLTTDLSWIRLIGRILLWTRLLSDLNVEMNVLRAGCKVMTVSREALSLLALLFLLTIYQGFRSANALVRSHKNASRGRNFPCYYSSFDACFSAIWIRK